MVRPEVSCLLFSNTSGGGGSLRFIEHSVTEQESLEHTTIASLMNEHPDIVFIAAKSRSGQLVMRPDVNLELKTDEKLIFAGTADDISKFTCRYQRAA